MASYLDKEGLSTFLDCLREEELAPIQNDVSNLQQTKADNETVVNGLASVAKQGENPEATLTAIYKLLMGSNEPSPDIPEGIAERLALILEFFGIKPIETYEFMTEEEVCSDLEEIMMSMDINLTPEKAKEITQQTLNN